MIEGLKLEFTGKQIVERLGLIQQREERKHVEYVKKHSEQVQILADLSKNIAENAMVVEHRTATELMISPGASLNSAIYDARNKAQTYSRKAEEHRMNAIRANFFADHVVMTETYRLTAGDVEHYLEPTRLFDGNR